MRTTRSIEFGGYTLDPVRRLLFDANGATIPLNARAFDTLLYLVENPGRLLSKQTLLQAIWPNSIVEENNLSQSILAVRRALGEKPGEHRFIVTVTGRGYRFVAPVTVCEGEPMQESLLPVLHAPGLATAAGIGLHDEAPTLPREPPSPPGWWSTRLVVPLMCVAALLFAQFAERAAENSASVAVLPFVDLTADRAQQVLADDLAGELLRRLADLPGLDLVSRSVSSAAGSGAQDPRSAGHALGADQVVVASLRAVGDWLQVRVRLIDTDSGATLWLRTYDRELHDAVGLQQELARTIALDVAAGSQPRSQDQLRR